MRLDPVFGVFNVLENEELRSLSEHVFNLRGADKKRIYALRDPWKVFAYYAEQQSRWRVQSHRHDFNEILFFLKGEGAYFSESGESKIRPGDIFLVRQGAQHVHVVTRSPLTRINLCFQDAALIHPAFQAWLNPMGELLSFFERPPMGKIRAEPSATSRSLLLALFHLVHACSQATMSQESLSALLRIALEQLERSLLPLIRVGQKDPFQTQVEAWIEREFSKPVSLVDGAVSCGLSPRVYSARFRKAFKSSFDEHLIRRRLLEARRLLTTSSLPIQRIIHLVGFNYSSYFNRVFLQKTGMTPRAYRNLYRKNEHILAATRHAALLNVNVRPGLRNKP